MSKRGNEALGQKAISIRAATRIDPGLMRRPCLVDAVSEVSMVEEAVRQTRSSEFAWFEKSGNSDCIVVNPPILTLCSPTLFFCPKYYNVAGADTLYSQGVQSRSLPINLLIYSEKCKRTNTQINLYTLQRLEAGFPDLTCSRARGTAD